MLNKERGLNITNLKLIALLLMILDHIYEFFSDIISVPIYFTWLGRLVFPIFMFAMTEGFYYTRSREKYMLRLYIGSVFMGIFNKIIVTIFSRPDGFLILNNIFSTIFMTVFYLYFIEKIKEHKISKKNILLYLIILLSTLLTGFFPYNPFIPSPFYVEGGPFFIMLGIIMYYCRDNRIKQVIVYMAICILSFIGSNFDFENLLYENYQWMMIFSVPLILLYNNKKGKGYKYLFYIFYPSHIYILYILSVIYFYN